MAGTLSSQKFLASDEAANARQELQAMIENQDFITKSPMSGTSDGFVQKHIDYLSVNTNINPEQYIANLRIKTRVR